MSLDGNLTRGGSEPTAYLPFADYRTAVTVISMVSATVLAASLAFALFNLYRLDELTANKPTAPAVTGNPPVTLPTDSFVQPAPAGSSDQAEPETADMPKPVQDRLNLNQPDVPAAADSVQQSAAPGAETLSKPSGTPPAQDRSHLDKPKTVRTIRIPGDAADQPAPTSRVPAGARQAPAGKSAAPKAAQ